MTKSIKRVSVCFVLMIALVFAMMPLAEPASAADRSAAGAVTMPSTKTLKLTQGVATKINFGTKADYDSYYYFQINPTKTGYITLTNDYVHGYDVALCNASKSVISRGESSTYDDFYSAGSSFPYQTVLHYGVKKGKTYFIRIKGGSTEYNGYNTPYVGTIKWTNSKVKAGKYGKKKKKASKLKKKKVRKGLFTAGSKKAQWYKIKTTKKKIKITFTSKANNGAFKAQIYYKSYGHWYSTIARVSRHTDYQKQVCTLKKNFKKATTYYIKVFPENKTSGYYTLKWK